MEKKERKKKRAYDRNVTAFRVVQEAIAKTEEPETRPGQAEELIPKSKNPHAVALGRLGAKKGGLARASKLTPEQRREIARKAANKRWRSGN